jgi:hypothetical protein
MQLKLIVIKLAYKVMQSIINCVFKMSDSYIISAGFFVIKNIYAFIIENGGCKFCLDNYVVRY